MTEDETVRQYHQHSGCEFEQTLGDSEGQECLVWYHPWDCKELDTAQQLNNNKCLYTYKQRDGDDNDDDGGKEGKININTDENQSV